MNTLIERKKLLENAVRGEKNFRVPTYSNFWTWKILDSDTKATILQANYDYGLMEKIMREFHERYAFDAYEDLGTRNMFAVSNALGKLGYVVNDETGAINAPDYMLIEDSEYDEITKDPCMFGWTKLIPRKFGNFTYEQYRNAIREFMSAGAYGEKIADIFVKEYGVPKRNTYTYLSPVEDLFSWGLRGFKGFSRDMRRCPEKIDAYIDAGEGAIVQNAAEALKCKPNDTAFDLYTVLLAHSSMSEKQFERFYYRTLKKVMELVVKYNGTNSVFCEASFLHIKDFFTDIPKGHYAVTVEQDDINQVKNTCRNICVCGGLTSDVLGKGTKEESVDLAKSLIDSLGDTGFIMSQNKMMSFRNDCSRENMMAVQNYVLNYRF